MNKIFTNLSRATLSAILTVATAAGAHAQMTPQQIDSVLNVNDAMFKRANAAYVARVNQKYRVTKFFTKTEIAMMNELLHYHGFAPLADNATLADLDTIMPRVYFADEMFRNFHNGFSVGKYGIVFHSDRMNKMLDAARISPHMGSAEYKIITMEHEMRAQMRAELNPITDKIYELESRENPTSRDIKRLDALYKKQDKIYEKYGYDPETHEFYPPQVDRYIAKNGVTGPTEPNFDIPEMRRIRGAYMKNVNAVRQNIQ